MSTWIITIANEPIYKTTSYPRFLVEWGRVEHLPSADWTTRYERMEHP